MKLFKKSKAKKTYIVPCGERTIYSFRIEASSPKEAEDLAERVLNGESVEHIDQIKTRIKDYESWIETPELEA